MSCKACSKIPFVNFMIVHKNLGLQDLATFHAGHYVVLQVKKSNLLNDGKWIHKTTVSTGLFSHSKERLAGQRHLGTVGV